MTEDGPHSQPVVASSAKRHVRIALEGRCWGRKTASLEGGSSSTTGRTGTAATCRRFGTSDSGSLHGMNRSCWPYESSNLQTRNGGGPLEDRGPAYCTQAKANKQEDV